MIKLIPESTHGGSLLSDSSAEKQAGIFMPVEHYYSRKLTFEFTINLAKSNDGNVYGHLTGL